MDPVNRAHQSRLGGPFGESSALEPSIERPQQGAREPDDRTQHLDAAPKLQDFRLKSYSVHFQDFGCDDGPVFAARPFERSRARHAELGDDIGIADLPDEVPKPMVIGLL